MLKLRANQAAKATEVSTAAFVAPRGMASLVGTVLQRDSESTDARATRMACPSMSFFSSADLPAFESKKLMVFSRRCTGAMNWSSL
eukprot:1194073-Pyramimonas_sp.AAC.1